WTPGWTRPVMPPAVLRLVKLASGDYSHQAYLRKRQRWHLYSLRLEKDLMAELKQRAQAEGTTVNELINTYVTWGLENGSVRNTAQGQRRSRQRVEPRQGTIS